MSNGIRDIRIIGEERTAVRIALRRLKHAMRDAAPSQVPAIRDAITEASVVEMRLTEEMRRAAG